jgi:hypothetical protein
MMYLVHIADSLTKLQAKNFVDSIYQTARVRAVMGSLCLRSEDKMKVGSSKLLDILLEIQKLNTT